MTKKKVLIASVLKPVNEPRMYKKLGLSIAESSNADVHIAGFKPSIKTQDPKITFHPIYDFKRLSLKRYFSPRKFYKLLKEIQPEAIIAGSFELLEISKRYKKETGSKLIYDIRENYGLNLKKQGVYGWLSGYLSQQVVNLQRRISPDIDYFLLAEKCYAEELEFLNDRYLVLENKYAGPFLTKEDASSSSAFQFVFTGTGHYSTGILSAIEFVKSLNEQNQNVRLTINSHCPSQDIFSEVKSINYDWLQKDISRKPIGYEQILSTLKDADAILAPYSIGPHLAHKVPTKLYEALANDIPIVLQSNQYWMNEFASNENVIHHDYFTQSALASFNKVKNLKRGEKPDNKAKWNSQLTSIHTLNKILDLS